MKEKRRKKIYEAIKSWIIESGRGEVSIDEFSGGRSPPRIKSKTPSSYKGEFYSKADVAAVFQKLQTEGFLGKPNIPVFTIPGDYVEVKYYFVLKTS